MTIKLNTQRASRAFWFNSKGEVVAGKWLQRMARRHVPKGVKVLGIHRAAQGWLLLRAEEVAFSSRNEALSVKIDAEAALRNTDKTAPNQTIARLTRELETARTNVPFSPHQNLGFQLAKLGVS